MVPVEFMCLYTTPFLTEDYSWSKQSKSYFKFTGCGQIHFDCLLIHSHNSGIIFVFDFCFFLQWIKEMCKNFLLFLGQSSVGVYEECISNEWILSCDICFAFIYINVLWRKENLTKR